MGMMTCIIVTRALGADTGPKGDRDRTGSRDAYRYHIPARPRHAARSDIASGLSSA